MRPLLYFRRSGDIVLRIQHDVSRRYTKTSKPGHVPRRFLTSEIRPMAN